MVNIALTLLSLVPLAQASTDDIPNGTLNVDRTMVRVGVHSDLDWKIDYPEDVTSIVEVKTGGTIVPKTNLKMQVRTLGVAFQSGRTLLPLDAYWSVNNSSWSRFFYGTGLAADPTKILIDTTVKKNDLIDFGARGWGGKSWLPFHDTRSADKYVTVLKNGDSAPSYAPAYEQGTVVSFLGPYIDGSGKIKIGPRDLIILWEASTAAPGTTYFDMQDLVILVTFK